jgi:hypothetical protein
MYSSEANMTKHIKVASLFFAVAICVLVLGVVGSPVSSLEKPKPETIEATAQGTSVQFGQRFNITLIIEDYSTRADRATLTKAFQEDKNQGLYKALSKMKAVGHIAIGGALGYDVSYIRLVPTPTGRTIRFITTRPISMREQNSNSLSSDYNLTAGELQLNDTDKSKSSGVLYPRAMLAVDEDNEIKFDLATDPYKLTDIIDRGNTQTSEAK